MIVPIAGGTQVIDRNGTEHGSPSQGFPKWKWVGILDWDLNDFGATVTGRYVSKLRESDGNTMGHRFYTDLQLRWTPPVCDRRIGLAIGANNLVQHQGAGLRHLRPQQLRSVDVRPQRALLLCACRRDDGREPSGYAGVHAGSAAAAAGS